MNELTRCFQNILTEFSEMCKYFWCAFQHTASFLNDSIIFNSVVLCIVTVKYLQEVESSRLEVTSQFALSYFTQIIHLAVLRLQFFMAAMKPATNQPNVSERES